MMTANRKESLHLYDYLCLKIGSDKEVKGRRLTFIAIDTSFKFQISSGSKSEGLDLKGSDIDVMFINQNFKVYESERDNFQAQRAALIMDTTETHPCFTRLCLHTNYTSLHKDHRNVLEQHGIKYFLSNKLYKQSFSKSITKDRPMFNKIHGPCISDDDDEFDIAFCLKCDNWISQAVPWITRPRSSWLSPEIVNEIIMNGVLFVPIGFKGSIYEDLEWRISFSVAEKIMIFSFNHTQLLCYALLKIVLKEMIEKDEDLKTLLCSYYLKTLMFWVSDDANPTTWRPDNIIPCFMACLQRLLYCVEYSTLLHYFISDFNFFTLRLSTELEKKTKLSNLLKNIYQQGIQCLSASETLHDYTKFPTAVNKLLNINTRLVKDILQISHNFHIPFDNRRSCVLLKCLRHPSKTVLSHDIFLYFMSAAHQVLQAKSYTHHTQNNKQQYNRYQYDLCHLLIGLHSDAVTGWLMVASFFYAYKNYFISLDLIDYALSKFTDEKCDHLFSNKTRILITPKQQFALDMMKNEKLLTTFKALTITNLQFAFKSQILPKELQQDDMKGNTSFHPLAFAHFLRFLCFFHMHDFISCRDALQDLKLSVKKILPAKDFASTLHLRSSLFVGIVAQMFGATDSAREFFNHIAQMDEANYTSASTRLRELE